VGERKIFKKIVLIFRFNVCCIMDSMNLSKYNTILFDWDGCLAQTLDVWLSSYKKMFAEYDLHPSNKEITSKVFGDWNGPMKLGIKDIREFNEKLLKHVNLGLDNVELYDGAREIIKNLFSEGRRLTISTSSIKSNFMPVFKRHQLEKYFSFILTAEDVKNHKPHPEIIETTIRKFNSNKPKTIIVGDSKSDLGAAQNAGIDSVLFFPENHNLFYDLEELKKYKPTYIVSNFDQLLHENKKTIG